MTKISLKKNITATNGVHGIYKIVSDMKEGLLPDSFIKNFIKSYE